MSSRILEYNLIAPFIEKLIDFTESEKIVWRNYGLTEEIKSQYLHKTLSGVCARIFYETHSLPDLLLTIYRQDTDSREMATILKIVSNDVFGTEETISQDEFQPDLWQLFGAVNAHLRPCSEKSINTLIQKFIDS